MRQSTIIFGTLLLAFVMYITLRGQLPAYLAIFTKKGDPAPTVETKPATGALDRLMNSLSNMGFNSDIFGAP